MSTMQREIQISFINKMFAAEYDEEYDNVSETQVQIIPNFPSNFLYSEDVKKIPMKIVEKFLSWENGTPVEFCHRKEKVEGD